MQVFGPKLRGLSMAAVFLLSAVFHEYVLIMALGFFYPVLFVMFMGAGCKYCLNKPIFSNQIGKTSKLHVAQIHK